MTMSFDLANTEAEYVRRFPNKRVTVVSPDWTLGSVDSHTFYDWDDPTTLDAGDLAPWMVIPNMVLLQPSGDIYRETNAYGFFGPDIDFAKQLIAVWGDSVVQGHRRGWIAWMSECLPEYQVLNGGVNSMPIPFSGLRALELNRRLTIAYNLFFPGLNTLRLPLMAQTTLTYWLHRLCDALPGVVFCTQPTSLNEEIVHRNLKPYIATKGQLAYRGGYHLWGHEEPTPEKARGLFQAIQQQNEVIRRVAQARYQMRGQYVPVIDLYQRFYTGGASDFRTHFVDAVHFREESYPIVARVMVEELAQIVASGNLSQIRF